MGALEGELDLVLRAYEPRDAAARVDAGASQGGVPAFARQVAADVAGVEVERAADAALRVDVGGEPARDPDPVLEPVIPAEIEPALPRVARFLGPGAGSRSGGERERGGEEPAP